MRYSRLAKCPSLMDFHPPFGKGENKARQLLRGMPKVCALPCRKNFHHFQVTHQEAQNAQEEILLRHKLWYFLFVFLAFI